MLENNDPDAFKYVTAAKQTDLDLYFSAQFTEYLEKIKVYSPTVAEKYLKYADYNQAGQVIKIHKILASLIFCYSTMTDQFCQIKINQPPAKLLETLRCYCVAYINENFLNLIERLPNNTWVISNHLYLSILIHANSTDKQLMNPRSVFSD